MDRIVEHVDVWAARLETDKPGTVAWVLEGLRDAGADLDFIIARRAPEEPGTAVVFVTPLRGDAEIAAAVDLGFNVSSSLHSVRVEGPSRPGVVADVAREVAEVGISLRGLSTAVMGTRYVLHLSFDSATDATLALETLRQNAPVASP
jgi:hypothetical protein